MFDTLSLLQVNYGKYIKYNKYTRNTTIMSEHPIPFRLCHRLWLTLAVCYCGVGLTQAQQIVAHYDFTQGLADQTGQQPALTLSGNAALSNGTLVVNAVTDCVQVNLPGDQVYVPGATQAIEIEARLRTDAVLGYGVTSAVLIQLMSGWDAFMQVTHDKWSAEPAQISAASVGTVMSKTDFAPYWTVGVDHHFRFLLDTNQCRVWVDGRLACTLPSQGALTHWARTTPDTLTLGGFQGILREVTVKRWDNTIPNYANTAPAFQITAFTRRTDGVMNVQWNSTPGKTYTIETSPDLATWTPLPETILTASALSAALAVVPHDATHRFVRVKEGNVFNGQGPLMISNYEGSALSGSTVNFQWIGNVPGVQQWQVLAGTAAGGSQYFQSPTLPASSTMYPVTGLPGHGENVYVTLRFQWNNEWQQKVFIFKAQQNDDLPIDREGIFPVARPSYNGVNQVLLLNNKWIIVAVTDIAEILARVDTLSNQQFSYYNKLLAQGSPAGNSTNWTAWTQLPIVRDTYLAKARQDLDETRYTRTNYYSLTSADDANYTVALEPATARQYYVGHNGSEVAGAPNMHYSHYCYLEMPQAMQNGKHYTVTLANGKTATFLYDETLSVSRAIKINQAGYLPDAGKKFAYIGAWIPNYGPLALTQATTFQVINAQTGAVALTGAVTLRESNPRFRPRPGTTDDPNTRPLMHGENVYQMDLSGLTQQGNFFISVPGVGRSWTFRHHEDAYGEPFYISMRGMFHQRACMKYEMPWTPWIRPKAHTNPVYESELINMGFGEFNRPSNYNELEINAGSMDLTHSTPNVTGGWYDAADYDRNLKHYTNIFDLLYAYELAPSKFSDNMLNIPESGNGIPDILDEAEYGMDVWTRSMNADGGVAGWLETTSHPTLTDTTFKWCFSRRTRWSSLLYAAAAAQFAELVAPFDAAKSVRYRDLALKAFSFGNNPANSVGYAVMHALSAGSPGTPYTVPWTELDSYNDPYLFHAKLRLYYLTHDPSYLTNIEAHLAHGATPWQWPNTFKDCVPWFYYNIAKRGAGIFSPSLINTWKAAFTGTADTLIGYQEGMSYRHTWPNYQDWAMAWGESCMANRARTLFQAYTLTNDPKYRDAAICNMDYMFGSNPMGMSWTSGIGVTYPAVFQHEVSQNDGIDDPVPGLTIYGIDGGPMHYMLRNNAWSCPADATGTTSVGFYTDPFTPLYRRWCAHPTTNTGQCEFTIWETVAATSFCCAMLLPDHWTPPTALKQRHPRHKDSLFGYWYLP